MRKAQLYILSSMIARIVACDWFTTQNCHKGVTASPGAVVTRQFALQEWTSVADTDNK